MYLSFEETIQSYLQIFGSHCDQLQLAIDQVLHDHIFEDDEVEVEDANRHNLLQDQDQTNEANNNEAPGPNRRENDEYFNPNEETYSSLVLGHIRSIFLDNLEFQNMIIKLTTEQLQIAMRIKDVAMQFITNKDYRPLYLFTTGGAGSGKSFLINLVCNMLHRLFLRPEFSQHFAEQQLQERNATNFSVFLLTAPTGAAAFRIGGATVHTIFKFGVEGHTASLQHISDMTRAEMSYTLRNVFLLIIDEVSMVSSTLLYKIDKRLKEVKETPNVPFGGISVWIVGDLFQLPPVGNRMIFTNPGAEFSVPGGTTHLWELFQWTILTIIMRQANDTRFAELLNRLRFGRMTTADFGVLQKRNLATIQQVPQNTLALFHTNADVINFNIARTNQVPGERIIVYATIQPPLPPFLFDIAKKDSGNLHVKLTLQINARVMVTHNIDTSDGLVNGALGTIIQLPTPTNEYCIIQFDEKSVGLKRKQDTIRLLRNNLQYEPGMAFLGKHTSYFHYSRDLFRIRQFPLTLAWAVTVHKSQGMTTDRIHVDLRRKLPPQMAYTAFSRATSLQGLSITHFNIANINQGPMVSILSEYQQGESTRCMQPYPTCQIVFLNCQRRFQKFIDSLHNTLQLFQSQIFIGCEIGQHTSSASSFFTNQPTNAIYHLPNRIDNTIRGFLLTSQYPFPLIHQIQNAEFELVIFNFPLQDLIINLTICCTYLSPNCSSTTILPILENIINQFHPHLFIGDFNMQITPIICCTQQHTLRRFFQRYNYLHTTHQATHDAGNILDDCFSIHTLHTQTKVISCLWSDHSFLTINVQQEPYTST